MEKKLKSREYDKMGNLKFKVNYLSGIKNLIGKRA